ncbi:hypothetical protein H206_06298 [Candidatus Electrothrix aarhusensis]|uniref:Uncharacterized protein n=1 Tax=Candidatus Electrothrix aarhusensis TaxID=1859131 RepID=A0A3S3UDC0_9BACT|nr:hypothetical protein H206_06298 [Candidatus Electrothrix aarhusensis]
MLSTNSRVSSDRLRPETSSYMKLLPTKEVRLSEAAMRLTKSRAGRYIQRLSSLSTFLWTIKTILLTSLGFLK